MTDVFKTAKEEEADRIAADRTGTEKERIERERLVLDKNRPLTEKDRVAAEKATAEENKRLAEEAGKLPALGPWTGGKVFITKNVSPEVPYSISQTYIGVGPLLVPCTRGEQKALSGDVYVQYYFDHPTDYRLDYIFSFLLPKEVADILLETVTTGEGAVEGATVADYNDFLETRAQRKLDFERRLHPELYPLEPRDKDHLLDKDHQLKENPEHKLSDGSKVGYPTSRPPSATNPAVNPIVPKR